MQAKRHINSREVTTQRRERDREQREGDIKEAEETGKQEGKKEESGVQRGEKEDKGEMRGSRRQ